MRHLVGSDLAGPQHAHPPEYGAERCPKLVRHGGQELVLRAIGLFRSPTGLFRGLVEACVVHGDRRLDGQCTDHALMALRESIRRWMAKEKAPEDLARARFHRHSQITSHRKMARGEPAMGQHLTVARIRGHVINPNDCRTAKSRLEDRRIPRLWKLFERLPWRTRQRVERIGLAGSRV